MRAGGLLIRLLARTWRIRVVGDEGFRAFRAAGDPVVLTLWHGHLLPLLWQHRNEGIAILISEHRDGEIIARIATALGLATVRGSTSRGAGRALIGLARALEEGRDVAITPDGPRGPRRKVKPGILWLAAKTGRPVVPTIGVAASAWRIKGSWTDLTIPKPFSRVLMLGGPFFRVPPDLGRDDLPRYAEALEAEMDRLEGIAEGILRGEEPAPEAAKRAA